MGFLSFFPHRLWSLDDFKNRYAVDSVFYTDEISDRLAEVVADVEPVLLTLKGVNSDR